MGGLNSRLRRVEASASEASGRCPECYREPGFARGDVFYPEKGEPKPEPPACPGCGRPLGYVIKVVYEGEGVIPIG
jgi:ribosomal protein S14